MNMRKLIVAIAVLFLVMPAIVFGAAQQEQAYPTQSINMIIPYGAGGGTDNAARVIASFLEKELGGKIVPVNKAGAGGEIGVIELMGAKPDGYTIGALSFPDFMISDIVNPDFEFDFFESVNYLGAFTSTPLSYYAMKDAPYDNLEEFVAYAKANPGKITVAEAGIAHRVMAAGIMDAFDIKYTLVNFNSANESISAMLGGHVDVIGNTNANIDRIVSAGGKVIAWGGSVKPEAHQDIPLFTDYGVSVDYLAVSPCIVTLKGTPEHVNKAILAALNKIVNEPELKAKLEQLGYTWYPRLGDELQSYFFDNFKTTKDIAETYSDIVLGN
jgi:tripartite-type tricarboxylate transporter receptor subunit TctC